MSRPAPEHYDPRETQAPQERERALFASLPDLLARAVAHAPGWAAQLAGIDPSEVTSREALASLPLLRKADLPRLQKAHPPFGGLTLTAPGDLARLYVSPGPIFDPEGRGGDWWGVARALFAVGLRRGDVVHNAFSYHLTPAGQMFETGAAAIGCAVIPAGVGNTEAQLDAIAQFAPRAYTGTPDFLKLLLDKAGELGRTLSFELALVSGAAFPASLKAEFAAAGITGAQAYGTADLGIVAYEVPGFEGLVLNEDLILEIVRPGTGDPVAEGEVGEVVITRLNADCPLFRFATGDLSAVLPGACASGRTNTRIRGWMGRADQATKVKGMFVHPAQVAEIAARHPELGRLRLKVSREGEQDAMLLRAEGEGDAAAVAATLQAITKLKGRVEMVPPGTLPNDGKVIADDRTY